MMAILGNQGSCDPKTASKLKSPEKKVSLAISILLPKDLGLRQRRNKKVKGKYEN